MAEGGVPPHSFSDRSTLDYSRYYAQNFEVRESLDDYMDTQPLDFSTKRRKNSENSDDSEKSSTIERSVKNLDISGRYSLADSSVTIQPSTSRGIEVSSHFSPMSLVIPMDSCNSSLSPPHSADPSPSLPSSLSPSTLARLQSNPLLLSTLQSALNRSNMSEQCKSYLTPRNTPSPPEFSPLPSVHSTDPELMLDARSFETGGLASHGLRAGGLRGVGLGAGGLGTYGLGAGGALGAGGFGAGGSSSSVNPYEAPSRSVDSHGSFGSLGGNIGFDSMSLVGTAYNMIAATSGVVSSARTEAALTEESNTSYLKFREEMLKQVQAAKSRRAPSHRSHGPDTSGEESNNTSDSGALSRIREDNEEADDTANTEIPDNDEVNDEDNQNSAQEASCSSNLANRRRGRANIDVVKDEAYWERRRKNNEAAKRSRDARRAKEDEVAIRAAFLEQENIKLKVELSSLKAETNKLRYLFYT